MSRKPATHRASPEQLEVMKASLLDHLNAGHVDGCDPLSDRMTCQLLYLLEDLIHGPPRVSRSSASDVRAVAIARDLISQFNVPREDAIEAAFHSPDRDLVSLLKQYARLLPKLAD